MAWPKRVVTWGPHIEAARDDYARVANAIGRFEPISMIVDPANEADARARCGAAVTIVVLPIDDSWLRDSGPTFVLDAEGPRAAACFTFNAWERNTVRTIRTVWWRRESPSVRVMRLTCRSSWSKAAVFVPTAKGH